MIIRHKVVYIVATLFILISCSSSPVESPVEEPDVGETIPNSEDSVYELPEGVEPLPEPNPNDLIINLEEGNTTEVEIGVEGGSLEVTAADGTHFQLVVPSEALFSPVTILMTPAESVEGVPFDGGALGTVHLQPEGLIFYQSVELFIQPPSTISLDEIASFGTFAEGNDFYLHPSSKEAGEVRLLISHFSNYGVTAARQAEIERIQQSYTPSQAEAYARNRATIIQDLVDDPAAQLDAYEKIAKQWFYNSVMIKLLDATVHEEVINSAIGQYLSWYQFLDMMGLLTEGGAGILIQRLDLEINLALDTIAEALKNAFEKAHVRCAQENKPEEALQMIRWGRVASYLEVWGRAEFDEEDAKEKITSCFSFEFAFYSTVDGKEGDTSFISEVRARIPLKITGFSPNFSSMQHSGDLTFVRNTISPSRAGCTEVSESGRMAVTLGLDLNFNYIHAAVEAITLQFWVTPFTPKEGLRCDIGGIISELPVLRWLPGFVVANKPFFRESDSSFLMKLPITREEDVFAELDLHGPIPGVVGNEASIYQLIHTPGR